MSEKIVLAFSGGLDTSISVSWLKKKHNLADKKTIKKKNMTHQNMQF